MIHRIAAFALLLVFAIPAHAILDAVSWQATRIVRVDGRQIETQVHHAKHKERISAVVQGVELDLVMHYDRQLMWQMTPMFSLAGETDISQMDTPANITVLKRVRLGEEAVAGQKAVKYQLQYRTRSGDTREGFYWQNAAGVHVKSRFAVQDPDGRTRQVELELKNLKVGPQPATVFEVPAEYRVMQVDATGILRDLLGF
jgi:hypothetical protein